MLLHAYVGDIRLHHDIRGSFSPLLRDALNDVPIGVALGPVYEKDPAAEFMAPFFRSARESDFLGLTEEELVPEWALNRARSMRSSEAANVRLDTVTELALNDWTRAGLVLEVATRRGIHVAGQGKMHVPWKMKATVTGRFGCEPAKGLGWNFNPLALGVDDRWRVRPSGPDRHVVVYDFKAMDLCSMLCVVPGLASRYGEAPDLHARTFELLFPGDPITPEVREEVKGLLFLYAYGGFVVPPVRKHLERQLPELTAWMASLPNHGDAARLIQSFSARAFQAALSEALPLLLGEDITPMFTVHDEVVLDVAERASDRLHEVSKALEAGARRRTGSDDYRLSGPHFGSTYQHAKDPPKFGVSP